MALPDMLQVNQALFGYSDGHRQLASSTLLPSKDSYELATRSDLSPRASLSGLRSYISGFELSQTRHYALIKTWPAPEMPRPGCVWSHVLLLPRSVLTTQVNLGVLEKFFRRPTGRGDVDSYKQELTVRRLAKSLPSSSPEIVANIISAYYENEPVLLEDTPDEAFERALFDVWSQQWPRLRSDFSFRTVQSTDLASEKGLAIKVVSSSIGVAHKSSQGAPNWVVAAVEDATANFITPLRRFLWRYGKDVNAPRRSFRNLVEIHALATGRSAGMSVARRILKSFPKASDALTLKRDLLGVSPPALALIPKTSPADLIALLATWRVVDDAVVEADELRDAIVALDQNELIAIAVALATLDQQPSREVEIATDAMIGALNRAVFEAAGLPTPVVLKIFRRRPEFLETFDLSGIGILDVIDLLDLTAQPTAVANIFGRILSETASHAARAAVERYPAAAFAQAIRCASIGLLHPDWTRVFGRLTEKILPDGLRLFAGGSKQAALGLRVLDYPIQGSPPATVWFDVLGDALEGDVSQDRSTIDAFLVALCLRDGVAGTITIILKTLPRLRFMAVNGALPFEAEKLLDVHLPSVSDGWDFNKRLLKILRKANRDGADIEAGIAGMMLTKDEINYIYNQGDEKSFPFSLPSFIWPWR